jgi:hypothetical protein
MSRGLTSEQVKALLTLPTKRKRGKAGIDTSVRDIATWFKLAPKTFEQRGRIVDSPLTCDNPDCVDPRVFQSYERKRQHVVNIDGRNLCRFCFLSGWLLENPDQLKLPQ